MGAVSVILVPAKAASKFHLVDPHSLFLASIVLCLLTRSAVSVIIAINRRTLAPLLVEVVPSESHGPCTAPRKGR